MPSSFFYRDKAGTEVDIVEPKGMALNLYEVKYRDTFYPEFLNNMKTVAGILKNVKQKTLIFNGQTIGDSLVNIRDI